MKVNKKRTLSLAIVLAMALNGCSVVEEKENESVEGIEKTTENEYSCIDEVKKDSTIERSDEFIFKSLYEMLGKKSTYESLYEKLGNYQEESYLEDYMDLVQEMQEENVQEEKKFILTQ